jgi:squalene synthase HpnD/squalene synthase HpnC
MNSSQDYAADLSRCQDLAQSHYENFGVGSWLLPRNSRDALAAIYSVVRIADDIADEDRPDATPENRIVEIQEWQAGLESAVAGGSAPHWAQRAGAHAIRQHHLELDCFRALFRAFIRDAEGANYETFEDLLGYCSDSANPVGRLVIGLLDPACSANSRLLRASDSICTGLQLINHWQDVAVDASRGRIYLPREDRERFGVDEEELLRGEDSEALRSLLAFEVARAREFLEAGDELVRGTRGRLRIEVALFRRAGLQACAALERSGFAVMDGSSKLTGRDRAAIVFNGIRDNVFVARGSGDKPDSPELRDAYEQCQKLTRTSGSSFAAAFWLLSADRRRALYAIYAFCRLADDIADSPEIAGDRVALLARWREELAAAYRGDATHPVGIALGDAAQRFDLPQEIFEDLLLGIESDLEAAPIDTFADLRTYCYRVASTVGILIVRLLGCRSPRAIEYAETLGIAVQLTNILRDVTEDAQGGRVYLPQIDLEQFGVDASDLADPVPSPELRLLLACYAERARTLFERADALLPPADRRALRPAQAMGRIYQHLLAELHRQAFVNQRRPGRPIRLSKSRRLAIATSTWLGFAQS